MSDKDSLGDRMKMYETVPRLRLVPKMPVLLRLDGKAFHTLTRGLEKPADNGFNMSMRAAALELCEQIQGCQLAYVQSDEITLLLVDYQTVKTQGWFEYEIQKMCSVAASIATHAFAESFRVHHADRFASARPYFDCRAWNLPREEVVNCFIWRQQDATRNSIQGLAQAHFSHKQLHLKDQPQMMDMLMLEKGINWNDCPIPQKRGVCAVKETYETPNTFQSAVGEAIGGPPMVTRTRWVIDEAIPIFTQDRTYVQRFVDVETVR